MSDSIINLISRHLQSVFRKRYSEIEWFKENSNNNIIDSPVTSYLIYGQTPFIWESY